MSEYDQIPDILKTYTCDKNAKPSYNKTYKTYYTKTYTGYSLCDGELCSVSSQCSTDCCIGSYCSSDDTCTNDIAFGLGFDAFMILFICCCLCFGRKRVLI